MLLDLLPLCRLGSNASRVKSGLFTLELTSFQRIARFHVPN